MSGSISQRYGSGSGSGSGSFYHQAKKSKKNLDFYCFVTSFGLFIFEKCRKSRKTFFKLVFLVGVLMVNDEKSRIRIHYSEAWNRGSGSTPKYHGSGRLKETLPQVLVYPEGLIGNGSCLLRFNKGCLASGLPVQPLAIRFYVDQRTSF